MHTGWPCQYTGSSPRMRGTLRAGRIGGKDRGIIPAYAGNTSSDVTPLHPIRDHPRVCGEHCIIGSVQNIRQGSSPRMRGTPVHVDNFTVDRGIIPAYAGNTKCSSRTAPTSRDHPRVCGEHAFCSFVSSFARGSSPRMRGTLRTIMISTHHEGIIPAYAGNTYVERINVDLVGDHPRVCGEHRVRCAVHMTLRGSSPRMRGTHLVPRAWMAGPGIIPAYAGNTRRVRACGGHVRDHPRVCGEHLVIGTGGAASPGSSPRMRGTLFPFALTMAHRRIIPAYAGNTPAPLYPAARYRDHPRVCGEHGGFGKPDPEPEGSSPRMRGTPWIWFHIVRRSGIIPAYAGNTEG